MRSNPGLLTGLHRTVCAVENSVSISCAAVPLNPRCPVSVEKENWCGSGLDQLQFVTHYASGCMFCIATLLRVCVCQRHKKQKMTIESKTEKKCFDKIIGRKGNYANNTSIPNPAPAFRLQPRWMSGKNYPWTLLRSLPILSRPQNVTWIQLF